MHHPNNSMLGHWGAGSPARNPTLYYLAYSQSPLRQGRTMSQWSQWPRCDLSGRAWHCSARLRSSAQALGLLMSATSSALWAILCLAKILERIRVESPQIWRAWFEMTSWGSNELLHEQQMLRQHKGFAQMVIAHGVFSHSIAIDVTKD